MRTRLLLPSAFLLGCALHADVVPASIFRDGAVLQREKPVPVWGTASAGEKVTVTFAGKTAAATAADDGKWRVDLPALTASGEPRALTITGNNTVTINDVVVGEVWLASGQSNMFWVVGSTYDAKYEAVAARFPLVRQYKTAHTVADAPATTTAGSWAAVTPKTVGSFTAVGYFFALDLHRALDGVPVGIINSSQGATRLESWMDPDAADGKNGPAFASIHARWAEDLKAFPDRLAKHEAALEKWKADKVAAEAAGKPFNKTAPYRPGGGRGHHSTPSGLYNAMINPHVPYALRGAIWYQGESNASRAGEYCELFSAMITGWRAKFGQGDFPFYWVQLANYRANGVNETSYAELREAQTRTLALPKTGQAVIIDIGNVTDIHPRNKKDVGRRLALLALARDYGKTGLIDSGPVFDKAERVEPKSSPSGPEKTFAMRVTFKPSSSPLISPLAANPPGFELAGEDEVFRPATAVIEKGGTVLVSCADVPAPVAVRYAWRNAPVAGLANQEGLPAVPFRSDDW
jgi:sialate O-acetylesterase